ncbi:MAG: bifunctional hydroxymethylpyrimidine kinase/phosphomethylpyrimidine kinase [Sulfolobales archaeon]
MVIRKALTIAGSDSGGGAGIQADLKTFAALGVHGMCVITSITAQNTYEVRAVHDVPLEIIRSQFEAVVEDIGVDAAKTGMLSNSEIIELVASLIKKYNITLVVDPVMVAKSGAPLLREDAVNTLINKLIPLATVITPNKPEAEKLSGKQIKDLNDARLVAKQLVDGLGARAAVVKGGHMSDVESIDILYFDGKFYELKAPRIESKNTHGTGCSFSAAITAELAKGRTIVEAVKTAKEFITTAIAYGLPIGRGHGPVNPTAWQLIPSEKYRTLKMLKDAINTLESHSSYFINLIPESQSEVVMTLPKHYVKSVDDIAGIPGKINKVKNKVKIVAPPEFGVKSYLSEVLIRIMNTYDEIRAAASIIYNELLNEVMKELGLNVMYLRDKDSYLEIITKNSISTEGKRNLPDVLIYEGGWGKEPLSIVVGSDALDVVNKLLKIAEVYNKKLLNKK